MIIALFALAVAMILGGLLAAILGWDIVLVERGWTMVIAGSITAASGALLLGITAAVSKLANIQVELMRLHAGLNEEEPAELPSSSGLSLAALAGGLFAGSTAAKAARDEEQPTLPLFDKTDTSQQDDDVPVEPVPPAEPEPYAEPAPRVSEPAEEEVPEPKVPEFLFVDRYRESAQTEARIEVDEYLYAPEPVTERLPSETLNDEPQRPVAPEVEHADILEPEPEPKVEEPTEEAVDELTEEAAPADRSASTIVGTYTSGDNKYVMFSNGSIEAQTPQGVFHFKSLDELKEFIASGGESAKGSSAT
jgi:hypothetical protein